MTRDDQKLVHSIQWLRACAAIAVVIRHMSQTVGKYHILVPDLATHVGRWGVDLFFVISGFIMVFITQRQSGTFSGVVDFWARRVVRIAPLYWIVTTVVVAMGLLAPGMTDYAPTLDHALASYFFIPWTDAHGDVQPALRVGWSLNYEMYFYLVFGLLMLLPSRGRPPALLFWALAMCTIGVLAKPQAPILKMAFSELLLEFAIGACVGWLWLGNRQLRLAWALPALVCGFTLLVVPDVMGLEYSPPILAAIPAAMILSGAIGIEASGAFSFRAAPLLRLGEYSYSLYLTHVLSLAAFGRLCQATTLYRYVPDSILLLADLAFAIAVAAMVSMFIEKPLHGRMVGVLQRYRAGTSAARRPVAAMPSKPFAD